MFLSAATLIKGGAVLRVWLGEAITAVTHQQRVTGDQETRTQQYPGNNVNHPGESDQGTLTRDSEEIKRKWSSHMSYNYTIPKNIARPVFIVVVIQNTNAQGGKYLIQFIIPLFHHHDSLNLNCPHIHSPRHNNHHTHRHSLYIRNLQSQSHPLLNFL